MYGDFFVEFVISYSGPQMFSKSFDLFLLVCLLHSIMNSAKHVYVSLLFDIMTKISIKCIKLDIFLL